MKQILFAAMLCVFAIAGCKREAGTAAPAPAESTVPAAVADAKPATEALPTDVVSEVDNSIAPEGFDLRAFAGTFAGTLPCADCPGIETTLELKTDGSYALHEVYQGRDGTFDSDGTWTAEDEGKRIRLDPDGKDDDDRLYAIVSNGELRMLDGDGNAVESELDYSLRRAGASK